MADYVGQQLCNYTIVRLLRRGAFTDVYLGEHVHLHTNAAIKIIHSGISSNDLQQFQRQARTIAHLIHPHIIRTLDFGIQNTAPFLIMDYAPGGTLRELHPEGTTLSPACIVSYVKQIAAALLYTHEKQIVHRYVKPENMLLGSCNEILLSDFNFPALPRNSDDPGREAQRVAYMAPEQLQGMPLPASDQYALGIVVYEWLCGSLPFQGSTLEIVVQHLAAPPPLPCQYVPLLSPAIGNVVLKALAKDPQQRFANVQEFATALEQAYLLTLPQLSIFPSHALHRDSQHPLSNTERFSLDASEATLTKVSASLVDIYDELTEREVEVLHLVAMGLTNAQIAEQLTISPRTVHAHVRSIYSKLGISSRSAATRYAIHHRIA